MNFLQICQRAQRECGLAAAISTVVGQSGENKRFVDWVQDAWTDIQAKHQDWEWLRTSTTFATIAGQAVYTTVECGIADGEFGMWARDTFRNYDTAGGINTEIRTPYINYEVWRELYQFGASRDARERPQKISITPAKSVALAPYPAAGYTVTADYFTAPVVLAADADTPLLPAHFHMAIVWRACMAYGSFEAASEVYQRGETEFRKLMIRIERDQLPEMMLGGPLA